MVSQGKFLPLVCAVANRARIVVFALNAAWLMAAAPVAADLTPDEIDYTAPVYEIPSDIGTLGERWLYKFYWSGLPVAKGTIEGRERGEGADRKLVVEMSAATNSVISLLWRYRLDAHGSIYVEPFRPGTFVAEENEKGREMATRIQFDDDGRVSSYRRKKDKEKLYEFAAPTTYEFMSTVYLLLNMEYELGRTYLIDTLTGNSRFLLTAEVQSIEPHQFGDEKVDAYRIYVTTKELTDLDGKRKHFGSDFWVSVDRPRRFLGSRTKTKWGAVTMRLVAVEPLDEPLPPEQVESVPAQESAAVAPKS
jgi:hypothetical protein